MESASLTDRQRMNAHFRHTIDSLLSNAERDERLARAAGDPHALATASARRDTLTAALGIYAAAHRFAYGTRPWPDTPAHE